MHISIPIGTTTSEQVSNLITTPHSAQPTDATTANVNQLSPLKTNGFMLHKQDSASVSKDLPARANMCMAERRDMAHRVLGFVLHELHQRQTQPQKTTSTRLN
ncbi:hypothetical protein TWF751_007559 [Orbilia oligospora]|nr:hypothetical protein TWF751_007559 [Orbilia oligospora]